MKTITINCEKLNHPNTGLYHYCANLSNALLQTMPADLRLQVYAPAKAAGLFPPGAKIITQHGWHKLINPANFTCDLWHATNQESVYFPKGGHAKKIITVHDLNYFHDPSKSQAKKMRFINGLQKCLRQSSHLVTISNFTLQEVRQYTDVDIPATVIYNGCNTHEGIAAKKPAISIERPFIFTIGTITGKKNFHVLPALLLNNDHSLVIAGEVHNESYYKKILQAAEEMQVSDRLVFAGAVSEEEKRWLFDNCLAFAFPSLQEGFGLPVVEAMAVGKPLFLSGKTSLPEIGGEDAFYFEHFEPQYMSAFFTSRLSFFEKNQMEISARLKERSRLFSWQEAALQHWKLYRDVLEN